MKRRRDEPWHITNGCIGSACEYVNQFLLIRWFDREYVDERNDTCVLGNRSHKRSPATESEIGPDPRILCISGRRHSPGDPKADTGHGLQLAGGLNRSRGSRSRESTVIRCVLRSAMLTSEAIRLVDRQ